MYLNTPVVLIFLIFLFLIMPILLVVLVKSRKAVKTILYCIFVVYIAFLIIGVFTQVSINKQYVYIAFNYSQYTQKPINWTLKVENLIDVLINLVMLLPVGIVLYFRLKKGFLWRIVSGAIVGLGIGVIIETCQYFLPVNRACQLLDVLLNAISVGVGTCLGRFCEHLYKKVNFSRTIEKY